MRFFFQVCAVALALAACSSEDDESPAAGGSAGSSGGASGSGGSAGSGGTSGSAGSGAASGSSGSGGSSGAGASGGSANGGSGGSSPLDGGAAYPNLPPGSWTMIGAFDGSVEEAGGSAFGIADFGDWHNDDAAPQDQIEVIDDATNPAGSGKSLRFRFTPGFSPKSGTATAGTFSAGTQQELYVMFRIFLEPGGWDFGSKFFYLGSDPSARSGSSTNQYYNDRPSGGDPQRLRLLTQNNGSVVIVDSSDPPPKGNDSMPLAFGTWLSIEHHLVAESASGAGDGSAHVWVNGTLVGSAVGNVAWNASGAPGFSGMQWYAQTNTVNTESYYRVGELYIAGR